jgi:hypothetical protein
MISYVNVSRIYRPLVQSLADDVLNRRELVPVVCASAAYAETPAIVRPHAFTSAIFHSGRLLSTSCYQLTDPDGMDSLVGCACSASYFNQDFLNEISLLSVSGYPGLITY